MNHQRKVPTAMMQWPLRFGTMPDDEVAAKIVYDARRLWPSSRLSESYSLTRDQPRCDVLVYVGVPRKLTDALRRTRYRRKARLLVLISSSTRNDDFPDEMHACQQCGASGSARIASDTSWEHLSKMLNELVNQLSHNETFQDALDRALGKLVTNWIRQDLSAFRLSNVAERINQSARKMASGMQIALSRRARELVDGDSQINLDDGSDIGVVRMRDIRIDPANLDFSGEGRSASDLAEIAEAMATAPAPRSVDVRRAARFLQQQSRIVIDGAIRPAFNGFIVGTQCQVLVRIGPESSTWQGLRQAFPDSSLPYADSWTLRVWLTEPEQLQAPMHLDIELRVDGPSQTAQFEFAPKLPGRFDARLTVTHRGRVLQTARFLAGVRENENQPAAADAEPRLTELLPVREHIGDLDQRRPFDLAFVTNHVSNGQPRAVALAEDHAWISDIGGALKAVETLNNSLSKVAKLVADYADGLDGELGRELMVDLARQGAELQRMLVSQQLWNAHNRPDVAEHEYIQIISTRNDHEPVPFEFIYDYEIPARAAKPCAHWRNALTDGACPGTCRGGGEFVVCPMGFWGMRKVIERHQLRADLATTGREFLLQSEPGRESSELTIGTDVLVAASSRVQQADFDQVISSINSHSGKHARPAPDWTAWENVVRSSQPTFILSMPHTDGVASRISLEIGGIAREALDIRLRHVRASTNALPPLVALIGCDTGTAHSYGEYLQIFRQHGAAVVLGTIATVFGGHAARVASLLADELYRESEQAVRLGEALRNIKRRALLEGLFMPMCLVAYGDADWRLVH